ncbi:hypothetical protein N665_0012s0268 [Sinapis alba]|nr:hypothetical protein N665_0012s0268 [Sinapis alba]
MNNNDEMKQTVYISSNINDSSVSTFITYLVAAFYRAAIDVVSEKPSHELEKGGCFSHTKLFVVVFSKPCEYSVACLEKLVKLLEFLQKESHVVVPVFTVATAMQIEILSGAFEALGKSYSADQVTTWQRLLKETMGLKGHEYTEELSMESELIEEIVNNVSEKLNPTRNIGIHTRSRELENLLCNQPWGFRSIGILGTPGIGKTTFVEAVFRRMSDGYDISRFFMGCNNNIIEPFSDEDFQEIPMEKFDLNHQDTGPCHRPKRLLLVLDGFQNAQDAESFLCGFNRFGPGSLLIITSSDREVLEHYHLNEIYELKGLNDEDALKLFTRCAFGEDVIDEKLRKFWMSKIKRCGGNPSNIRSQAEKIMKRRMKTLIDNMELTLRTSTVSLPLNQPSFFTRAHKYQSDLKKISGFDQANRLEIRLSDLRGHYLYHDSTQKFIFCTISSKYLSDFKDLSLLNLRSCALEWMPIDLKTLHLGQEYLLVCQVNNPWEEYKVRKL